MKSDTQLRAVDALWLNMETADTPMHVAVLAVFELPASAPADFVVQMAARMRAHKEPTSPWDLRLSTQRAGALNARLVPAAGFDLDYHFRHVALPGEGGERELGMLISRIHSQALDRYRPLWEFHLIEGLEAGSRFAFYLKLHHALLDNVNAVPLLLANLSDSAERAQMPPPWARSLVSEASVAGRFSQSSSLDPLSVLSTAGRAAAGLLKGGRTAIRTRSGLGRSTPHSTLNRRINAQRRVATQLFERARVERLAADTGSSLEEILTYLCGSSLRRFFKEYNALPEEPLIGLVPVSLEQRRRGVSGNVIDANRVSLATEVGDPVARLDAVKQSVRTVRERRMSVEEDGAVAYEMLRAAPLYARQLPGVQLLTPPLYNLRFTHTAGGSEPRYFDGARLLSVYPLAHLMQYSALSIGVVDYAGMLNIGFTGARDTLPHLQRLAVYFGKALEDLEERVGEEESKL